ncbi:MAG: nitrogen regulation protein NR(II) [Terriglobales bacterium]
MDERRWFWATLVLSSISIIAVVFAFWELVENHFFREADYVSLHYLYISRGIASSLLLALWSGWYVLRQRRTAEEQLRRSRERYRSLLHALPGAIALYDRSLQVAEWNDTAVRLYGYTREEVLGGTLPTVPPAKEQELSRLAAEAEAGKPIFDLETLRRHKDGTVFDVSLSLLHYQDPRGRSYLLEVTTDIRERVRLRQTLVELEKLTSMGKMAAGTAHHLNTPLASMLLRVQMMRERAGNNGLAHDLEQLERTINHCQQFVRRLLDFSRRPPAHKQPEDLAGIIEGVIAFLTPALNSRSVHVALNLEALESARVLGDRNQLESLFLILLSNAMDAMSGGGVITIFCRQCMPESVEVVITDSGCGIEPQHLAKLFEPFFTTKPPGKGTGLGLAIARNIALEHGGSVRLESTVGQGTSAIVVLPLCHRLATCVGEGP